MERGIWLRCWILIWGDDERISRASYVCRWLGRSQPLYEVQLGILFRFQCLAH